MHCHLHQEACVRIVHGIYTFYNEGGRATSILSRDCTAQSVIVTLMLRQPIDEEPYFLVQFNCIQSVGFTHLTGNSQGQEFEEQARFFVFPVWFTHFTNFNLVGMVT